MKYSLLFVHIDMEFQSLLIINCFSCKKALKSRNQFVFQFNQFDFTLFEIKFGFTVDRF